MKKQRNFEPNPKTPLDNWSVDIDPAIMSGDHWAEEENAPLEQLEFLNIGECEEVNEKNEHPYDLFMHPTINVSYGNLKREPKKKN
ncbi:DUF3905 domain-containing protein [Bacillaceae bacterium IKA-2]|nr:DUF3905 domain-containing protein [Bacillaceae bacterium IKA-2]